MFFTFSKFNKEWKWLSRYVNTANFILRVSCPCRHLQQCDCECRSVRPMTVTCNMVHTLFVDLAIFWRVLCISIVCNVFSLSTKGKSGDYQLKSLGKCAITFKFFIVLHVWMLRWFLLSKRRMHAESHIQLHFLKLTLIMCVCRYVI